mgnify:CR=1 FL=1
MPNSILTPNSNPCPKPNPCPSTASGVARTPQPCEPKVLLGPTPWTPLGCISTLLLWSRRGTVAPLVPYKVTFGALYLLMNVVGLVCRFGDAAADAASGVTIGASSNQTQGVCQLINADGLTLTYAGESAVGTGRSLTKRRALFHRMLTNSAALSIFRF